MTLTHEDIGYQWALPESLEVPQDELKVRLDFYGNTVVLHSLDGGIITTRMVDARQVAMALLQGIPMNSGLLPEGVLWWSQRGSAAEVALWRPPQVWPAALQAEAFKPPVRYRLPMPGLIFICRPGSPPRVYAAKKRPTHVEDNLYHAPLFNVFNDGRTCAGTHNYPENPAEVPDSFFTSFFTPTADWRGRSKKYPNDLRHLWDELNGKRRYPLRDLVFCAKVKEVI
ncbi:hypothetical protein ES703_38443 [subsurface metagenome]